MTQQADNEIEEHVCAMFRRAWRKARKARFNFSIRYDWRGEQHKFVLLETELESETISRR